MSIEPAQIRTTVAHIRSLPASNLRVFHTTPTRARRCRSRLCRLLTGAKHPFAWFEGLGESLAIRMPWRYAPRSARWV